MGEHYKKSDSINKLWNTSLDANDSSAKETLGAERVLEDGRAFRYVQMTGSAGVEGNTVGHAAATAITSTASGGASANNNVITDSSGAMTSNQYVGYYFKVDTAGTGSEESRKIVANTATTLTLEKALGTAASADSAEILPPPGVVILTVASAADAHLSGVIFNGLTEDYYGWVQIRGYANVIATSALTEGDTCSGGGATTAGQAADRGGADDQILGTTVAAGGANDFQLVDLNCA